MRALSYATSPHLLSLPRNLIGTNALTNATPREDNSLSIPQESPLTDTTTQRPTNPTLALLYVRGTTHIRERARTQTYERARTHARMREHAHHSGRIHTQTADQTHAHPHMHKHRQDRMFRGFLSYCALEPRHCPLYLMPTNALPVPSFTHPASYALSDAKGDTLPHTQDGDKRPNPTISSSESNASTLYIDGTRRPAPRVKDNFISSIGPTLAIKKKGIFAPL